MTTMNISLPSDMKTFIDEQVADRGFMSSSEYLRDLVRREQDRQKFRALIQEGADSPLGRVVDDSYFEELRGKIGDRSR